MEWDKGDSMKKTAAVMCAFVLMCAALCAPVTHARQAPVQVDILIGLGAGSTPEQMAVQNALAEEWNAAHEDIKVVFQPYGELDALATLIAAGDPPAIVGPIGIRLVYLIDNYVPDIGASVTDLAPLIARDAAALALDDFDARSREVYAVNGRILALPFAVYPSFMLVNETLFAEAGVELPPTTYGTWTWDELRARAIRVTRDVNGVYADQAGFDPAQIDVYGYAPFWSLFRGAVAVFGALDGGVHVNPDGTLTATFDQAVYREAAMFYHEGVFRDRFITDLAAEEAISWGFANPFASGRIAMGLSHTWLLPLMQMAVEQNDFADQWNVYPVPAASGVTTAPVHADTFIMLQGFEYQEEAWEVYQWLLSPVITQRLCGVYRCMPARISARAVWEAAILEVFPFLNLDVIYGALAYQDVPNHERDFTRDVRMQMTLQVYWDALRTDPDFDVYGELDAINAEIQVIFEE